MDKKYCPHCGKELVKEAVICTGCGRQLEDIKGNTTIINNNVVGARGPFNKWVAFILCFLLGYLGVHKFYEGKIGLGILYLFTGGLFGIGWFVDWIVILTKSDPYYL